MDSPFLVLAFAVVFTTVCAIEKSTTNSSQKVENQSNVEINKNPYYPNIPEEPEPYYNPSLYGPSAYGYGNMMMHPSKRIFHHPYGVGYPRPMYMGPPPSGWGTHFPESIPPAMAYWLAKLKNNKFQPKPQEISNEQQTTLKTQDLVTTTSIPVTTELIPEVTTQVEIETTEQPKQVEAAGEDPKERQLTRNGSENNCGPDEESANAPSTVNNIEQFVTTATPESVPVVTSEKSASAIKVTTRPSTEEEAVPVASLRRNVIPGLPVHPEMALPPMYPGSGFPPMSYLSAMSMDPYASYRRISPHMFPRIPGRYYGF